jgi:hypothetical protein
LGRAVDLQFDGTTDGRPIKIVPIVQPAEHRLTSLDDLYNLAHTAGITIPDSTTPAS